MATEIAPGPGMVTSNIVGSTYQNLTPEQERQNFELRQMAIEKQEQRKAEREAAAAKEAQDANLRAAYEKIYAPYIQSVWDQQQGKIVGAEGMASGNPQLGSVYMKGGNNAVQSGATIGYGQKPYEYRKDTNMPADLYQQSLNDAFEMWKAGKVIGIGDTKVTSTNSRLPGGSAGKSY